MSKQVQKKPPDRTAEEQREVERVREPRGEEVVEHDRDMLERKGDEIEEELDRLDEIIDEALSRDEEAGERTAQQFVDHFKQEGGE